MEDISSVISRVRNFQYIPPVCVHSIRHKEERVCIADIDVDKDQLAFTLSSSDGVYFVTWHLLNDDPHTRDGTIHDVWKKYTDDKIHKLQNQKNKISDNLAHLQESLQPYFTDESQLSIVSNKHLLQYSCFDKSEQFHNKPKIHFIGGMQDVTGLSFIRDGNLLLSSSAKSCVNAYSTYTCNLVKTYTSEGYFSNIDVNPDNTDFVTGGGLSLLHSKCVASLFHFDVAWPVTLFEGHEGTIECVKYHPNGLYFATTSSDKTIKLWDLRTKKLARNMQCPESGDHPRKLVYSVDGKFLASTYSTCVKIWDLNTSKILKTLTPADSQPNLSNVCYNQMGNILAASGSNTIHFWDMSKETSCEGEPQRLTSRNLEKRIKSVQCKKNCFVAVVG